MGLNANLCSALACLLCVNRSALLCCAALRVPVLLCAGSSSPKYDLVADRYHFCEKCFNKIQGNSVTLGDDPAQPQTYVSSAAQKALRFCLKLHNLSFKNKLCTYGAMSNLSCTSLCSMISKEQFEKKNDTLDPEP